LSIYGKPTLMKQRGQVVTDKILDTAARLFYFQGYNNTGINQVIEEADIAKASLYKHFESKSELVEAYLDRTHDQWLERLIAHIDSVPDPKQKLLAIFDYHIERQQVREFGGCPFVKANTEAGASEPGVLERVQRTKEKAKKLIFQLVAKSGHKKMLSDKELADMIFLLNEGAIVAGSIFKRKKDLETAKALIQKLI